MANFKPEQSLEEMLKIMNKNSGNTETIHAGASFIQYKLQEKLLKDQEKKHEESLKSQNTHNEKQLLWTKILAVAAILSSIFSTVTFLRSNTLAEHRPYVGIEKIEIEEEGNRLKAKTLIVNTSSVPANNLRVNLKQFVDGELIVDTETDQFYSSFLLPTPNYIIYRFWGDKKVVEEERDWTIQLTFNYDGISSKDHETQFSGRYDPINNAFSIYQGYAD